MEEETRGTSKESFLYLGRLGFDLEPSAPTEFRCPVPLLEAIVTAFVSNRLAVASTSKFWVGNSPPAQFALSSSSDGHKLALHSKYQHSA